MGASHEHDTHVSKERDHDEHHGHGHGHGSGGRGHDHALSDFGRAFAIGIALQAAFIVGEVVVGLTAHSLAVLADAGHNASDVLALMLAWGANRLSLRAPTRGRTYGLKSASIMAALANALMLVFVNGGVAWEAVARLSHPEPVAAVSVIAVSLVGVAVNGFSAWLFASGSDDLNVRAAFVHLASDAAVAAGVALTGVAIHFTGLVWLDPVASLAVAAVVMATTWSLLKRALELATHAVPRGIDETKVKAWLRGQPGVAEVHDLHIWGLSTTESALTVHLVMDQLPSDAYAIRLDAELREHFGIQHVTVQLDPSGASCGLQGHGSV
ncbi:MAG TPA: cation diffusion facilitator family transporter [Polyangiaceae bacterium]|nr:cation diffusion facilitator family transporter [Polyangiaceae bacterium]